MKNSVVAHYYIFPLFKLKSFNKLKLSALKPDGFIIFTLSISNISF